MDRRTHKKGNGGFGPRPHVWRIGPDEDRHKMYLPWGRARAQANYRQEVWHLSFEDYYQVWKDSWHLRGRKTDDLCMTRIDWTGAWQKDNVILVTRADHCRAQAEHTAEKYRALGTKRKYVKRDKGDDII